MHDVNWWLMALSFVLGLLLTFAFTIRRVQREVPETAAFAGRGPGLRAEGAAAAGAAAAGGAAGAKFAGRERGPTSATEFAEVGESGPYGVGSARAAADGSGPSGWTVKGNEDSMLYHTPESPSYAQTIAEVWFIDEESAERAGFSHWRKGRSPRGRATEFAEVGESGPYGVGSARAAADGSGPSGWTVKGNEDSMLYHTPESPSYAQTIAEVWFIDEESAERGGFTHWHERGRKR